MQRDMNKAHNMSQLKISTIPVETYLYEKTRASVSLLTFDQFPKIQLDARWDPDRMQGRQDEKLGDWVYLWIPPAEGTKRKYSFLEPSRPRRSIFGREEGAPPAVRPIDVYEIRQRFLDITTPEQGFDLFDRFGIFGDEHRNGFAFLAGISFSDILRWQAIFKRCRLTEPADWGAVCKENAGLRYVEDILKTPEVSIPLESPIRIRLLCGCVRDAIMAANYLDKLGNVKSAVCHRPDCGVVYDLVSKHARKFCTPECAHLDAVRRSRMRKAGAQHVDL